MSTPTPRAPVGVRWRLIEVDYNPNTEAWTVWHRRDEQDEWCRTEADPGELGAALGIAHDSVTGG